METRTRYIVEYDRFGVEYNRFDEVDREWYPHFFTELENAIIFKERMLKDFGENKVDYRIKKETINVEIIEEGKNYI